MREIKFRGKRVSNGDWVYGCLNQYSQKMSYILVDLVEHEVYRVLAKTVGQFTGLTDKNGKDIYEGDIIESDAGYRHLVGYDENVACFSTRGLPIVDFETPSGIRQSWINEFGKKTIGNIHDNPELLQKGGEE